MDLLGKTLVVFTNVGLELVFASSKQGPYSTLNKLTFWHAY
jgi:hypothetical protein